MATFEKSHLVTLPSAQKTPTLNLGNLEDNAAANGSATHSSSFTAISDIPIIEPITGNKRHTYYTTTVPPVQPPPSAAASTLASTKQPSFSKDSDKQPLLGACLLDSNVDLDTEKGNDTNAVFAETSLTTKVLDSVVPYTVRSSKVFWGGSEFSFRGQTRNGFKVRANFSDLQLGPPGIAVYRLSLIHI